MSITLTAEADFKEIGKRFQQFRNLVGKSISEFAQELNFKEKYLEEIEAGMEKKDFIAITDQLYRDYGMSSNWLITGLNDVFVNRGPKMPQEIFDLLTLTPYVDETCNDISLLVAIMANPKNKPGLHVLHQKLTEIANAVLLSSMIPTE